MADDDVCKELREIKMLMILQLLNAGTKQRQIALALGVSEATVSRLLPKGMTAAGKSKPKGGNE